MEQGDREILRSPNNPGLSTEGHPSAQPLSTRCSRAAKRPRRSNRRSCVDAGVSSEAPDAPPITAVDHPSVEPVCNKGIRCTRRPRMNNRRISVDAGVGPSNTDHSSVEPVSNKGIRSTKRSRMSNPCFSVDAGVGPSNTACWSSDMSNLPEYNVLPSWTVCVHCAAVKFNKESKGFCCSDGQVRLKCYGPPKELEVLFTSISKETQDFLKYVRSYNCNFSMTSFGVHCDKSLFQEYHGIYTFRIQGQVYHFLNDIVPSTNTPSYLQLYLFDSDEEPNNRLSFGNNLTEVVVVKLINILNVNPYIKFFRSLGSCDNLRSQTIRTRCDPGLDQRRYNAPTVSQVAAVCVDTDDTTNLSARDIVVHCTGGAHHRIQHYFGCYDPLQYPLLFPYGESGWHRGIKLIDTKQAPDSFCDDDHVMNPVNFISPEDLIDNELKASRSRNSKRHVSCRQYYCYKLQIRQGEFHYHIQDRQ